MPDVLFFAPTGVTEHGTTVFCDECSMRSALQGGSQVFVCSNILCPSGPRGRDLHASAGVTKVNVAREARKVAGSVVAPAPTEGAGAPTGSVPPHPQHEDGSHLAVASLTPVSGGHPGPPPPPGQTRPLEALTPSPPPSPANTVVISDCRGSTAGVPRPAPAPLTARPEPHSLFRPCVCSCSELCVCSSFCVCLCVCSSHAPARHPASPVAPRSPDPVSSARFTVSHSSSPTARTATTAAHKESDGSAV